MPPFTFGSQIVAFSVVLSLAAGQTCDQPLRIYLALHLTRITLSLPRQSSNFSLVTNLNSIFNAAVSIYAALVPPVPSRRDTAAIIAAQEANRRIGSPRLDLRLRKISDLLALASVVLFILANVWIFSSTQCDRSSPLLYYGALSAIIISYLYVAEVCSPSSFLVVTYSNSLVIGGIHNPGRHIPSPDRDRSSFLKTSFLSRSPYFLLTMDGCRRF